MVEQSYYNKADEIIAEHGTTQKSLIPIIQDIQAYYRYLPAELLTYVAKNWESMRQKLIVLPLFYENFSFEPKGKYVIRVCDGTACHVRKSTTVLDALYKELKLSKEKAYHG